MAAGSAPIDETRSLPSEASVVELQNGSVLMNTRNSCHRLPAPHTCCWGDGCYDKAGVPHCHGPKVCDHAHDNRHTRLLMFSDTGGMSWSDPEWCQPLPDPDCEGSMVSDVDTGAILFANNKNGTIGNRDNMTIYRSSGSGACDSWEVLQQVDVGPAGYSCIAGMPGARLGIVYEHAWSAAGAARNDRDRTNLVFQLLDTSTPGHQMKTEDDAAAAAALPCRLHAARDDPKLGDWADAGTDLPLQPRPDTRAALAQHSLPLSEKTAHFSALPSLNRGGIVYFPGSPVFSSLRSGSHVFSPKSNI